MGLGYDDGTVLIKIGREEPVASMDASGKIIWARQNEVQTANVKALGSDFNEVGHPCCPAAQLSYRRFIAHAPTARQRVCLALHDWLYVSRLWPSIAPLFTIGRLRHWEGHRIVRSGRPLWRPG